MVSHRSVVVASVYYWLGLASMDSEVEACAECSRNCLLIHRKHDPSVIVCSFFKVMYGKHFVDVVILGFASLPNVLAYVVCMINYLQTVPPRFARLASLVAQETYLEDSSGRKWNVILSDFNGSVAIGKGWNRFVVDHGIQPGDFVVFHYIRGSHFLVQTYGTHGCEKLSLSGENAYQNKRAKTTEYSVAMNVCEVSKLEIDDIQRLDDVDVVKERLVGTGGASSQAKTIERLNRVSTSDFLDDTQFIINRDQAREEDRDYLFDLSVFEVPNKNVNVNKTHNLQIQGYRCSHVFDALQKAQVGTGSNSIGAKKCLTAEGNTFSKHKEEFLSRKEYTPPNICPRSVIPLTSNMPQKPVGVPCNSEFSVASATVKHEPKVNTTNISGAPTAYTSLGVVQEERLSSNVMQKSISIQQKSEFAAASDFPGVKVGLVKQEPRQFSQKFCDSAATEVSGGVSEHNSEVSTTKEPKTNNGDLGENLNHMVNDDSVLGIIVKPEPVDPCDSSSAPIAKIPCLVQPDSESFLELPDCLPLKSCGQAAKVQLRLVFLQDPARRVWPVLYHQKYGLNVLASGWRAFREANNIQPGDECTLVAENMDAGRFLVQILHGERF
ncbi:hypothetical protein Cgig2_019024 [Carnegiea gigantea]|uniref:TF-B3 domain-containing protein n=1 Tax=Carnegiea gigantea TaxID=171969 RepID=A0A9Q1Q4X3_9CARY|nr:hypothetical protein Cgig2_019024 [Carnegiea gigantea]